MPQRALASIRGSIELDLEDERPERMLGKMCHALGEKLGVIGNRSMGLQTPVHLRGHLFLREGEPHAAVLEKLIHYAAFWKRHAQALMHQEPDAKGNLRTARALVEEQQQYAAERDGERSIVIFDGETASPVSVLEDYLACAGALSQGKPMPSLKRETLGARLQRYMKPEEFECAVKAYEAVPIIEAAEDAPIRRLCSAMTACGLVTEHSCEGHGGELPYIIFHTTPEKLELLIYQMDARSNHFANERWFIRVIPGNPSGIRYILEPLDRECTLQEPLQRYERALEDLDAIGVMMMHRFLQARE